MFVYYMTAPLWLAVGPQSLGGIYYVQIFKCGSF